MTPYKFRDSGIITTRGSTRHGSGWRANVDGQRTRETLGFISGLVKPVSQNPIPNVETQTSYEVRGAETAARLGRLDRTPPSQCSVLLVRTFFSPVVGAAKRAACGADPRRAKPLQQYTPCCAA